MTDKELLTLVGKKFNSERAVKLKYEPIETDINNKLKLIDLNKDNLTKEQKKQADILTTSLNLYKDNLDAQKKDETDRNNLALDAAQNHTPVSVVNKIREASSLSEAQRIYEQSGYATPYSKPSSGSSVQIIKSGNLQVSEGDVSKNQQALEQSRGKDGYANTKIYTDMFNEWVTQHNGLASDFFKYFPPTNYINPNDPTVPQQIKIALKKPANSSSSSGLDFNSF